METTWQDIVAWAIGIGVALVVIRWLRCALRGKGGGCASCSSKSCALKSIKKEPKH